MEHITPEGVTSMVVALTGLTAAMSGFGYMLLRFWQEITKNRRHIVAVEETSDMRWKALIDRAMMYTMQKKLLIPDSKGGVKASAWAAEVYADKQQEMRKIRIELRATIGREPDDYELSDAILRSHEKWLKEHACRILGVKDLECLVVACAVAREE